MTAELSPKDFAQIHAAAFTESRPWSATEFQALLETKHCFWIGDSHGFALGRAIAGESELLTIAVAPEFQGKGLGRRLLEAYHAEAHSLGATTFLLEVARDNIAAIKLYESAGYQQISVRKNYYARVDASPVDALILRKDGVLTA